MPGTGAGAVSDRLALPLATIAIVSPSSGPATRNLTAATGLPDPVSVDRQKACGAAASDVARARMRPPASDGDNSCA